MTRLHRASLLVLAVLAGVVACSSRPPAAPPSRAVRAVPAVVGVSETSRLYSGSLLPRTQVELSFRVAGRVESVAEVATGAARRAVQEGDRIKRGDVLATLDPRDLRHQATAAAASEAIARSELAAATTALVHVETEARRSRTLLAAGAIAKAEADRSEAELDAARGRVAAARGQLDARGEQLSASRRVLDDARLISPIDGVVARRAVDAGETATPGRTVFTIIDDSAMRITFAVPDTRVAAVQLGAELPVRLDALPAHSFRGVVTKVEPVADPALRTFAAEVTVDNARRELRAGMVAMVELDGTSGTGAALRVPLASVLRVPGGDDLQVWVVSADGTTVNRRLVAVADIVGDDVVIERGLAAGERVVVDGAALLHDGAKVSVRP